MCVPVVRFFVLVCPWFVMYVCVPMLAYVHDSCLRFASECPWFVSMARVKIFCVCLWLAFRRLSVYVSVVCECMSVCMCVHEFCLRVHGLCWHRRNWVCVRELCPCLCVPSSLSEIKYISTAESRDYSQHTMGVNCWSGHRDGENERTEERSTSFHSR